MSDMFSPTSCALFAALDFIAQASPQLYVLEQVISQELINLRMRTH
jgi:hypothetical protein